MTPEHPPRRDPVPEEIAAQIARARSRATGAWQRLAAALEDGDLTAQVDAAGVEIARALASGHTLLVAGNGGSAAMASHIAAEFLGKCVHDRAPLPALNLAESLSSVTAIGNDYGFAQIFTRGVAAHGRPGDVLLALSTSGSSENVVAALDLARERDLRTILLTGVRGERRRGRADHVLVVPSDETPRVQEVHLMWAHAWCEAVDVLAARCDDT